MSDITREEAIKILKDTLYDERTPNNYIQAVRMGREALENQKTGHWIPVSERLPNHDEYIKNNGLFNVSDGNRSYTEWFDIYEKQMFGEPTISDFRVDYAVTAWMPLPQPYKAELKGENK